MAQDEYSSLPSDIISPFSMPPPQYNMIPPDPSSQTARSQVLRRLSTQSSSTSNSGKRGSARVTKLRSAENSPHNVQRRRTTAAHTTRGYPRTPQDNPYLTREQRLWNYYKSRQALLEPRPFSWHPGSAPMKASDVLPTANEPNMGTAIAGLENLAVSGTPPSSVQQSIQDAFSMGYGYPVSIPSSTYDQQFAASQAFDVSTGLGGMQNTLPSYSTYDFSQPTADYTLDQIPLYQPQNYPISQWSQTGMPNQSTMDSSMETAYQPPVQPTSNHLQYLETKELPETPQQEGDELVGIGLYDNEDSNYVSTINSAANDIPTRLSLGKDLKLEQTWQPATEPDDDGDSSEEAEEAEDELPVIGSMPLKNQDAFYPTYGDLSNQSFFFNDDVDTYTGEDQYPNILALDDNFQAMDQPKPQPAGSGNLFWF